MALRLIILPTLLLTVSATPVAGQANARADTVHVAPPTGVHATDGAADQYGSIAPGRIADLVIVDGSPAERIRDLRRTRYVVRAGRVYRSHDLHALAGVNSPDPASVLQSAARSAAPAQNVILHNVTVVDVVDGSLLRDQTVSIERNRITTI
jgi:adenine deaminase